MSKITDYLRKKSNFSSIFPNTLTAADLSDDQTEYSERPVSVADEAIPETEFNFPKSITRQVSLSSNESETEKLVSEVK
jgi:hypothetical protein